MASLRIVVQVHMCQSLVNIKKQNYFSYFNTVLARFDNLLEVINTLICVFWTRGKSQGEIAKYCKRQGNFRECLERKKV